MRPNEHGRRTWNTFLRKAFTERPRVLKGDARKSFERDAERIRDYLDTELRKSAERLGRVRLLGRGRFLRGGSARRAGRRRLAVHRIGAASLSADAGERPVPALCRVAGGYELRAAVRLRPWHARSPARSEKRQDAPNGDGRLVAAAVPAPHRELPSAPHQGSGRGARSHRPRRVAEPHRHRLRRGHQAAADGTDAHGIWRTR